MGQGGGLDRTDFLQFLIGGCVGLERTDFLQFLYLEGVVVLKELIFTVSIYGRCGGDERTHYLHFLY